MNNIECVDRLECCGCGSCMQKCPKNAITMQEDKEGFLIPVINKELCINCGLCTKVCPQLKEKVPPQENYPQAYAVYNKNEEELLKSSSGGMFSVIANYVLENGGIVFGAAYNENNEVNHISVENKEDLAKLRKSKYIQSNINTTFKEAENNLKHKRIVLYTGTPCQINALKTYLNKDYDNLITCDLICHGVPSIKAFKQYIRYLEKCNKSKIISYDFRTKDKTTDEKMAKIIFENGKVKYCKYYLDPYYNNFLHGNIFRESCYNCKYADTSRTGDISIGDYLGILNVEPKFYIKNGISICLVNTKKGETFFRKISNSINSKKTTIEKVKKYNSNLNHPVKRPIIRDSIFCNIDDEEMFIRDLKRNIKFKHKIKGIIPIKLKNSIRKIGGTLR